MRSFGGITNKAICWGISAMLGISPMVGIWGAPHAPKSDAAAIRENTRTPIRRTQAVWGAYPKPPISPMACIWELPKPQGVYGERPMPPSQTLSLFGVPNPSGRRKLFGEPTPSPQYLRWCVFGRMPKPQGVYGESPMPPMSDAAAIRENTRTPIIPFFTFILHSIHDTKLQLERHGVLSTAYRAE